MSFFIDAGGREDRYPGKPNNGIVPSDKEHPWSLFVDLPGPIEGALADDAWKILMPGGNR